VIGALASAGPVDVFLIVDPRHEADLRVPPGLDVRCLGRAVRSDRPARVVDRLATMLPGTAPEAVRRLDVAPARRAFDAARSMDRYDVAWFVRIESWLALGNLVDAPAIVDYDDLRDRPAGPRLGDGWPAGTRDRGRMRASLGRQRRRADATAWRRLQRRVATQVDAVVVCSELDRARLGVDNAAVVPNSFDVPECAVGRTEVGQPPTIVLPGSLAYGPNADAATVLARDVLPRVQQSLPGTAVRLVGRTDPPVERLGRLASVTVTGPVDDMVEELARADIVAVPLREGAGTRIKVLEAMAQRIPVVATTVAVEGLDVEAGRHLDVADTPAQFAASCVRLLQDEPRRRAYADAAEALVRGRYSVARADADTMRVVTDVVRSTASSGATPPSVRPS